MLHILGYSQQTLDHPWLPGCPVPRWSRGISQFCFKVIHSLLCLYVDHQPPAIKVELSKVRFGTKGGTPYLTLNSCPSSWNATPTTHCPVRLDSCICIWGLWYVLNFPRVAIHVAYQPSVKLSLPHDQYSPTSAPLNCTHISGLCGGKVIWCFGGFAR